MSKNPNIERWDTFLQKIKTRASEYFAPARSQAMTLFVESGYDGIPVGNALQGIRAQMLELCAKVDDTWDNSVSDLLRNSGLDEKTLDQEERKRGRLRHALEVEFTELEMDIRHQMAEQIVQLAEKQAPKTLSCTQCLAPLPVPEHTYQAEHVVCKFCQTVNTYEPGTYRRMMGGYFTHIAHWKSKDAWKEEAAAELAFQESTETNRAQKKAAHREAYKKYCEKFLNELKALNPNTDIEKELKLAMEQFDS
jgi:hypothetical protein